MAQNTETTQPTQGCVAYRRRRCEDVAAVRIEAQGGAFLVVCGCGWRSSGSERVQGAVIAWQNHRDRLG